MQVMSDEWLLEVARGNIHGAQIIHKFGANRALGSTWETICTSGTYQTPATPQSLEIVSDNVNDTVGGSGAHSVEIYGLDSNFDMVNEIVEMNGTTPVALSRDYMRVHRMHVYRSGSYATVTTPSHQGTILLQGAGGGDLYADIVVENGFPIGSSEIGCFSIPRGYTGYIVGHRVVMETNKTCDIALFIRQGADITTGGEYTAMFTIDVVRNVSGLQLNRDHKAFSRPLVGPCDTGWIAATTSGSAKVSVMYDILILDDNTRDKIGA